MEVLQAEFQEIFSTLEAFSANAENAFKSHLGAQTFCSAEDTIMVSKKKARGATISNRIKTSFAASTPFALHSNRIAVK